MKERLCRLLINDRSLDVLSKRLAGSLSKDLIQEVAIVICEKTDEELEKISGYFNFWAARTIINMASKKGDLRHYRTTEVIPINGVNAEELLPDKSNDYDHEIDAMYQDVIDVLAEMYWYDRRMFYAYMDEGSLRKVEAKSGIPYSSVNNTIRKVRATIKDKLC